MSRIDPSRQEQEQAVDDRRSFPRIRQDIPIRFNLFDRDAEIPDVEEQTRAKAKDISGGGICFTSPDHVEPRRMLAMELDLPGSSGRVLCMGKVVWCRRAPHAMLRYDVGVEFWWVGLRDETAQREVGRFILGALRREGAREEDASAADG